MAPVLLWLIAACVIEEPREQPVPDVPLPQAEAPPLPLLGWPLARGPDAIPGLERGASNKEWLVDPEAFAWPGPPVTGGRLRFEGPRLVRGWVTSSGRESCDTVRQLAREAWGAPSEQVCTDDLYETDDYTVRYSERTDGAECTLAVRNGTSFAPPTPVAPALDDGRLQGILAGAPLGTFKGLVPQEEGGPEGARRFTARAGGVIFPGIPTYGLELRFWEDRLRELTIRGRAGACQAVQDALLAELGEPSSGKPSHRIWRGCEASVQFRSSQLYWACAVQLRSPAVTWAFAEATGGREAPQDEEHEI